MVLPLIIGAAIAGSAGLAAVGKILGGVSAKTASRQRAATLRAGAQMDLDEAGVAAQLGLEEDERQAGALATYAASGSGGGLRGSAMAVLNDLGRQSLQKAHNTVYGGQTAAWSKRNDASVAKADGRNALTAGIVGAGSTLLAGAAKAYAAGGAAPGGK